MPIEVQQTMKTASSDEVTLLQMGLLKIRGPSFLRVTNVLRFQHKEIPKSVPAFRFRGSCSMVFSAQGVDMSVVVVQGLI